MLKIQFGDMEEAIFNTDANGLNPTKIDVIAYVDVAKED